MLITDWIHTIAGTLILVSLALGVQASPVYHSDYWLWLATFVGVNLLQFGITKFCPLGFILEALGVPASK